MLCREENFIVFMYVLRSIVIPWSGLRNFRDQNHAHIYFVIFPWLALYVALVYLIHRWTLLEKMRKTLSEAILVAIKVLTDNVCACEKRDLVKPRFWKRAWILLRREVNYFKNKCGDPTIFFQNWVVWTKRKLLVKLKEILWTGFIATQKLRFLTIT